MEKATEAATHIDAAYRYASAIMVNGDNVDKLAMARQEMRTAYKLLTEKTEEKDNG